MARRDSTIESGLAPAELTVICSEAVPDGFITEEGLECKDGRVRRRSNDADEEQRTRANEEKSDFP